MPFSVTSDPYSVRCFTGHCLLPIELFFNQFQNNHLSRIAHAGTEFQHASITTVAVCEAGSDLIEQAFDDLVITQLGNCLAARMNFLSIGCLCAITRQRNEAFRVTADCRGFCTRSLDALMREKLFHEVAT